MRRMLGLVIACLMLCTLQAFSGGQQGKDAKVTLNVWDQWVGTSDVNAITMIHEKFYQKFPNVRIERTGMITEQIKNLVMPAMSSGTGPDIIYPEADVQILIPLIKAKAIMDLTDVWKERWDNKLYSMSKEFGMVGNRAWAVGNELEFTCFYYYRDYFKQLGVTPPTLVSELEDIMAKIKQQGSVPLTWGGRTWWLPSNYATNVLWAWMGKKEVDKAVAVGGTWKQPAVYDGIKTAFVTWGDKGYYPRDAMSLTNEEAFMLFYQGTTQLFPGGNAFVPGLLENVKNVDNLSSFMWPVPKKGLKSNTTTWCGSQYIVSASTKAPKQAIAYIDFLMATEDAARIWYEVANRIPPYKKPIANLKVNPLVKETLDVLTSGSADLTPAHNTLAPPEAATWMTDGIVKTYLKQITPEAFVDELDRLWQKGRQEGMTRDTVKLQ